ncbi:MAG: TonB-dependent receptor [Opitutaceae bacterium]
MSAPACLFAGDISGQIVDANTETYLEGATVNLSGTNRSTVTDSEGRYRFGDVDPGSQSVTARYIGYESVTQSVQVPETGMATLDIRLGGEFVEMTEFVIEGYREGRSRALQQKRTSLNLVDMISADSVGTLPDRNVAEALARIPGVSLDVDGGEGRFVSIRGIEPNFNTVTLDGSLIAPPSVAGREGRAVPLDVVGSGQISQIEVIKAITPDMDGSSLGGTINIKSASGFDRPERFIFGKVEVGTNSVGDGTLYDTDITYGDTFADERFGVALSVHYSDRPYASQELQSDWTSSDDGEFYPETLELQPEEGERTRRGLNYNFEFQPDNATELFLRGIWNSFKQDVRQQEFIMGVRSEPEEEGFDDGFEFVTPTLINVNEMRFEQRDFRREIDQALINVTGGIEKRIDNMTLYGDVTYSYSEEDVPFIKSVQFRTGNLNYPDGRPFQLEFGGTYPNYNDQGLYTSGSPELYDLRRYREEDSYVEEKTWSPRLDLEWALDMWGRPSTIKTGVKYTTRNRFVDDNSVRPVNDDFTMAEIAPPGPGFSINEGRYMYPSNLDLNEAFEFLNANRDELEIDPAESAANSTEDDYDVEEDILALYAMGTMDLSERLQLLYGVRYERTDATLIAPYFVQGDDVVEVTQNDAEFKYDNWLPNLQLRYNLTENSVLRFAFTGTIGRPQYEKATPNERWEYERLDEDDVDDPAFPHEGSVQVGNPNLEPYESLNFDLAYEYYFQSGALLSAGLFRKEIDNPIYTFRDEDENVVYNELGFAEFELVTERNADKASLNGIELNAVMPFNTFIRDSFLDGFGIDANATFISSDVEVIQREGDDLPFFRQPERIYNVAFYYQKYGISARVAWNYADENVRELSDNADEDVWESPFEYTDVQASYKINENFSVYVNWKNIFEESEDSTLGRESRRMRRSEFYGSSVRGGVRYRF